jgi:hypothetical protein
MKGRYFTPLFSRISRAFFSLGFETGVPVRAVISHGFKKWLNIAIAGNSTIVIQYMLDSQFRCSHIESREVQEKKTAKTQ